MGELYTSYDGLSWIGIPTSSPFVLVTAAYGNGKYVAAGNGGSIYSSFDGNDWQQEMAPTMATILKICYDHGNFLAVCSDSTIITSPDGSSWTVRDPGADVASVMADETGFLLAGGGGGILRSGNVNPDITVSPPQKYFGNATIGTPTAEQSFTVLNTGPGELAIGTIILEGGDPGQFAITYDGCSGTTIPSGLSATFRARFLPTSAGYKQAQVVIPSNDPDDPLVSVMLSGMGIQGDYPVISVSPASGRFGNVAVGTVSPPQVFTVGNAGSAGLAVYGISIQGDAAAEFIKQNDNCTGRVIAPGASGTFEAVFAPLSSGLRQAAAVIATNDRSTPSLTVPMSGFGQAKPAISVSPGGKDFGNVPVGAYSLPQLFTVTNADTIPLVIGTIRIVGAAAANTPEFVLRNDLCSGKTLNHGESATFEVLFSPVNAGRKDACVNIPSNDPGAPILVIPLGGTGTQAVLDVIPRKNNFGDVMVGKASSPQTFTVWNNGNVNLSIGFIRIAGDDAESFVLTKDQCSLNTIAPGMSRTFQIIFRPDSEGEKMAVVLLPSDDPQTPVHTIGLWGNGIAKAVVAEPASKAYPEATPGGVAVRQIYVVTNFKAETVKTGKAYITAEKAPEMAAVSLSQPAEAAYAVAVPAKAAEVPAPTRSDEPANEPAAQEPIGAERWLGEADDAYPAAYSAGLRAIDAEQFSIQNDRVSGSTLQPGESATLEGVFAPTRPGTYYAAINIPMEDPLNPILKIGLSGTAPTGARISAWPFLFYFGEIMLGARSARQTFTVSSIGLQELAVADIVITGRDFRMFRKVNDACSGRTFAPGEAASFEICFAPVSPGCKEASAEIYTNDLLVPVYRMQLYGRGCGSGNT